jgi:SAM-dependent methyltransferase
MSAESEWKHQYTNSPDIAHHRAQNLAISRDFLIHAIHRPKSKIVEAIGSARLIVEHGCGTGELTALIASKLPPEVSFVGMDFSSDAISLANDYLKQFPNLNYKVHDLRDTNYPHTDADICIISNVIEHFNDWTSIVDGLLEKYEKLLLLVPYEERIDVLSGSNPEDGAGGHCASFNRNSFIRYRIVEDMVFFSLEGWGVSHAGECPLQYAVLLMRKS